MKSFFCIPVLSVIGSSGLLAADVAPTTAAMANLPLASQSYGELRLNQAVDGGPLRIAGKSYAEGLGSHAVSEIPLAVPSTAVRFSGAVGVDDGKEGGKGSVKFRILSGNAVLWESPEMKSGDPAVTFDLPILFQQHQMIYLQADDLGDNSYDHADWVDLRWTSQEPTTKGGKVTKPTKTAKTTTPHKVLDGAEFGLKPDIKEDQSQAMRNAIQALRENPGSTVQLAKGEYHFYAAGAISRHFHISNHDQPKWHPVSIPLVDLHGATLDGQGSVFVFHGEVQPVLIMDSQQITMCGIGIDYAIPHHSQGNLLKVEQNAYEVAVDMEKFPHEIRNGWFVFKGEGWEAADSGSGIIFDGKSNAIVAGTSDFDYRGKLTTLAPGRYRVEKDLTKAGIEGGDVMTFRQGWQRPHPAVTLYRAKDTVLVDCVIHASHGMGLLAQRSENIRLTGGGVYPRKSTGRLFSTSADATHFSNCKGRIIAENGVYEGMMDDAINVHATCLRIEEKIDSHTLRCRYVHGQSIGFETFLVGETLRLIQAKWMMPRDLRKVKDVRRTSNTEVIITLDGEIADDLGVGDAVENADWFPEVVFRGNTVRHNRARGSLFTTPRKVVVENNNFESIAGSAILLAGDANGWYESGGCQDVLIHNNIFRDNLTSRFQFTEAIISIYPEIPDLIGQKEYYHRNVKIDGNRFETFDVPLVFAISAKDLTFSDNKVSYNNLFASWKKPPFILKHCERVVVSNNKVTSAGNPVKWTDKDVSSSDGTKSVKVK